MQVKRWNGVMMKRHTGIGVRVMVLMSALVVTVACGDDDSPTAPTMPSPTPPMESSQQLGLSFNGLESLGDGFVYEGWIMVNGSPVSTGTFTVNGSGNLSRSSFPVPPTQLAAATKFILTIEPSPDNSVMPAATKYLAGDFSGRSASLSVADAATLMNDFSSAAGSYILAAPSAGPMGNYANGIWWLNPAGPSPGLMLPMLPAGWMYEGWVVVDGTPTTTGRFSQVMGADSDGGGAAAGPMGTPPFPGQDFASPPMRLIGGAAVISIEPEPDNSPGPFTLKPLVDMMIEDDMGQHMQQMMENHAGSFPTGMATR